ncbi:MAG: ABC transporter ATP-binding protein [Pelomonas sp.]|nr:ABC transporter ATP-binding protein [Roseateles sp.]
MTPDELAWPLARLGEALEALAQAAGLASPGGEVLAPPPPAALQAGLVAGLAPLADWLHWAASRLQLELEPAYTAVPDADASLRQAGPALVPWTDAGGAPGVLLLLAGAPTWRRRGRVALLGPDGRVHHLPRAALSAALCQPAVAPLQHELDELLATAAVPPRRRAAVSAAWRRERFADTRLAPWWQLRLPPSAPLDAQARQARLPQRLLGMMGLFAVFYAGEVGGWAMVGQGVLAGRLDAGWLMGWVLLLFTLLPLRLAGMTLHAGFARRAATLLKARLLVGALQMDVDRVRREGVGALLGRVIESSALESLAVGGGLATLLALIELTVAAGVLSMGAAGGAHVALLLAWAMLVAWACSAFGGRLAGWTRQRLALTHDLIEQMVGHRTRLAQEQPERRTQQEDAGLSAYLTASRGMDGAGLRLQVWLPAGWLAVSLAVLVPGFMREGAGPSAPALAISVGGLLLAQRALAGLAHGLGSLARAAVAWQQVSALYAAGKRDPSRVPAVYGMRPTDDGAPLLDAQGLRFAHAAGPAVLQGVDLAIHRGDRLLLQGASGGGKSTLAALLTGLRRPQSGLLLQGGLDAPTLGERWQANAASAPQFHENHIVSHTVAFNLLMGSQWPPTPASLREAEALCEELGLGELLRRMPAGLQQRIGETGWQLSHGERSRIFLARALLQRAPLTVLDESFAALDPEHLAQCLACVRHRTGALLVIAHP